MAGYPPSSHGGRPPALEPLMAQDGTLRATTTPFMQPFVPGREGLKTAGTIRGNTLGATSNLSEADTIKVAVRVRPLFQPEKEKGASQVVEVTEDHTLIKLVVPGPAGNKMQRDFAFHACLGPEVSQADVLHMCGIPQLLDAALAGYNVTVFAYGQTGSGKTFTMSGREDVISTDDYKGGDSNDGIMSRAVGYLYQTIQERKEQTKFALSASYLEIYNEGIFDLLNLKAKNLPVKWDAAQGFYVPGLKSVNCGDVHSMLEVIRTAMKHRHVGSHELNIESSRSHSIMTITCCATPLDPNAADYGTSRFGKICFVDLAGSERLKDSKSEGVMLKETANINKSLFVLGKVISALAERDSSGVTSAHIPYRDSKLTKLLMDSLGGCAMALMIATCSPSSLHVEETLSTLSYATRAKNIQNRPVIQYDPKEQQIAALRREIDLLRQENMYLREQIQLGGGMIHTSLRESMSDAMPLGEHMGHGSHEADPNGTPSGPSVTFGEARSTETPPQWPQLVYSPASSHGMRPGQPQPQGMQAPGVQQSGQQQLQQAVHYQAHMSGQAGSGGGAVTPGGVMQLMRSASPRLGSMVPPSPRTSPLSVSFAAASANGGSASHGGGSTWSMLEPHSDSPGGRGLVGASMESLGSVSGGGAGGLGGGAAYDPQNFNRRLKETQALLARFAEENNRLAKENDKLRTTRTMLGHEHADVLDEIEQLRSKLSGLESAVMTGSFSPADVKALLSGIKQGQVPPKTGSSVTSNLRASFSAASHTASPLGFGSSSASQQQYAMSQSPAGSAEQVATYSEQGQGQGLPQPPLSQPLANPMQPHPPPSPMLSPHPPPSQPPPGSALARRSSSGNVPAAAGPGASPSPPRSQPPQGPAPAPSSHHKQEVANVMAMGSSHQAAMRTRQGSMGSVAGGGGKSGGGDGIIVADQAKLSLLLGLGSSSSSEPSASTPHAAPAPPMVHMTPQPPPQPMHHQQQAAYRLPSSGSASQQPGLVSPGGYPMGAMLQPPMYMQHPGSAHGMVQPGSAHGMPGMYGMAPQGMAMPPAMAMPPPQQPVMPAALRPLPVKPGGEPLNPTKQAHEQALIRRMLNAGAL